MMCLTQDHSTYSALTEGSKWTKIGSIAAYKNSIDAEATDLERKRGEVMWKAKLNDSKVKASTEWGTKKKF